MTDNKRSTRPILPAWLSGLRLAIVKSIIDQHGRQISVTSWLGKGSYFTFFNQPLMQKVPLDASRVRANIQMDRRNDGDIASQN